MKQCTYHNIVGVRCELAVGWYFCGNVCGIRFWLIIVSFPDLFISAIFHTLYVQFDSMLECNKWISRWIKCHRHSSMFYALYKVHECVQHSQLCACPSCIVSVVKASMKTDSCHHKGLFESALAVWPNPDDKIDNVWK